MTTKPYIIAPDRTVTTAERVFSAGQLIDLADEHAKPLLACGAVIESEQPVVKGKKKTEAENAQ